MIHQKIELWPEGMYQSKSQDGFRPTLDIYILDGDKRRGAVVICPGGGYGYVSEREGEPVARQFSAAGFQAFVLNYSVSPHRHPQPLLDISRAMCLIREQAGPWKVDPMKIAVCGFSAGGHLAASLGVHWNKPYIQNTPGIVTGMNQPNALILSYPVISSGEFGHRGSFENLLGDQANEEVLAEMSLERQVNSQTPPAFIWHTFNDGGVPVENSMLFANALRRNVIPFELHIYPDGPHGLSLATKETDCGHGVYPHVASWMKLCMEWLEGLFGI
jgi:acetyl esterase/lipase